MSAAYLRGPDVPALDTGQCLKIAYRSRADAEFARTKMPRSGHRRTLRQQWGYRCQRCGAWHLTSKRPT